MVSWYKLRLLNEGRPLWSSAGSIVTVAESVGLRSNSQLIAINIIALGHLHKDFLDVGRPLSSLRKQ